MQASAPVTSGCPQTHTDVCTALTVTVTVTVTVIVVTVIVVTVILVIVTLVTRTVSAPQLNFLSWIKIYLTYKLSVEVHK